ncbi:hypothetical protein [Enterobacter asburiae]|uniref:hypothetical protein n=1 Tax=Enterobacter asburiae TaxID=61645 RepID=UPI002FF4A93F
MHGDENYKKWARILEPKALKERVISYSFFIASFELLKEIVIGKLERFYLSFGNEDEFVDYREKVLNRNKSRLYASISWLTEHNALEQCDIETFERLKKIRNKLSHEMFDLIPEADLLNVTDEINTIISLTRKIELWWFYNLDMAIDPDSYPADLDLDEVMPMTVLLLQVMREVALGDEQAAHNMFVEFTRNYKRDHT